jgi:flagellar hook-basal body complex protein FliE
MIDKISPTSIRNLYELQAGGLTETESSTTSFMSFLKDSIAKVNDTQLQADRSAESFLKGESIDVHKVMISLQKAEMTLNLAMQLRNKVLSAYEEVMRMQI